MRRAIIVLLQVIVFIPLVSMAAGNTPATRTQPLKRGQTSVAEEARIREAYGNIPLYFIENRGQMERAVKFYEKGPGHATFFTKDGLVLSLAKGAAKGYKTSHDGVHEDTDIKSHAKATRDYLTLSFVGTDKGTEITAENREAGHVNYFVGNDRSKWRSNIPVYGTLLYKDLYRGVDMRFYGNNRRLEHDVIVHPGGDLSRVRFVYHGARDVRMRGDGGLEVSLEHGRLIEEKPVIYQEIKGRRVAVKGGYRLARGHDGSFSYGFYVASYDHTRDLVIDPVLVYSTYLGGIGTDWGESIAVDNTGAAYVTGSTDSFDFPVNSGIQGAPGGSQDAFITKLNPAGTAMVYSTYLGGTLNDVGQGIAVDGSGAAYVTGQTLSTDFPLVTPLQGVKGAFNDAFVAKLNPAGSAIVYSTYLGGNDQDYGYGIAVDGTGAALVVGSTYSGNFPTFHPLQFPMGGFEDAFVTKINPAGTSIDYSTFLGGNLDEDGHGIAVDGTGNAYVTGQTSSLDFPLLNPILTTFGGGGWDAFVTKINSGGTAFMYSTYLGGSNNDMGYAVAVNASGEAYVAGSTSSVDFPVVGPIQGMGNVLSSDAFVSRVNTTGNTLLYSTYLGGSATDEAYGIAVNSAGEAYVTGWTISTDFPVVNATQGTFGGVFDAFVTRINPTGTALVYSTYLGGSGGEMGSAVAVDSSGAAYVTGDTFSTDFPMAGPLQGLNAGGTDAFVSKIGSSSPLPAVTLAMTPDALSVARGSTLGYNVTATNTTATKQCFNYWENVTLPNSATYPAGGAIFGPVYLCLNAGASKSVHLTEAVPVSAPIGTYIYNAFTGIYPVIVVSEAHFNFNITAFNPAAATPAASWHLIENGFAKK